MKFQAIKGVRDILPPESALWNRVEQAARDIFQTYGYGEIRLPEFELARLFERGVGGSSSLRLGRRLSMCPSAPTSTSSYKLHEQLTLDPPGQANYARTKSCPPPVTM